MLPPTLRIIDASLNRIGEGLRLLEDIARFFLNDAGISQELKALRHELIENTGVATSTMLSHRNASHDVGANFSLPSEEHRANFPALVQANSRRVEQSLRVIEECAKLPEAISLLNSVKFKQARFSLYELEQKLISRITRQDKRERLSGLYVIIDGQALRGRDEIEVTSQAIRGGARVIQLRDKARSKGALLPLTKRLQELCTAAGVLFIVNDDLDLALAANADGLHIGQDDLPLAVVRKELPVDRIVGCSVTNLEQARKAEAEGADYIAVGSMYPTPSKESPAVVGLETLRRIREITSLPLIAIGGINYDNVPEIMGAGAEAVAVISAVLAAEDVEEAARQLAAEVERIRGESRGV